MEFMISNLLVSWLFWVAGGVILLVVLYNAVGKYVGMELRHCWWCMGIIALASGSYVFNTHGPRLTVDSPLTYQRYTPSHEAVAPRPEQFGTQRDRVGQFDERIATENPRDDDKR